MELNLIIKGCINRESKAQKAFVQQFSSMLHPICLRYAGNESLADDFLQEALIQILYNIDKYKEEGKFSAWAKQVTVRKCIELLRKNKKYSFNELLDIQNKVDEVANYQLEFNDVNKFLLTLPDHYRLVINMYLVEGFSHKEIANKLGVKESASRTLLSRARAMVKKAFDKDEVHLSIAKKKLIKKVS